MTMIKTKKVFCTFESEHLHRYSDADNAYIPGNDENDNVQFLKYTHRHIFKFRVEISITKENREIEFILMKHQLKNIVDTWAYNLGERSCEDLCIYLYNEMIDLGYEGDIKIEVSEDGENGAIYEWNDKK